jgi:hypothetical protein
MASLNCQRASFPSATAQVATTPHICHRVTRMTAITAACDNKSELNSSLRREVPAPACARFARRVTILGASPRGIRSKISRFRREKPKQASGYRTQRESKSGDALLAHPVGESVSGHYLFYFSCLLVSFVDLNSVLKLTCMDTVQSDNPGEKQNAPAGAGAFAE